MSKPRNYYAIEINPPKAKGLWIGLERGDIFAISLGGSGGKQYTAPIERVYATLARWHAKENPTGKKRRKFFTSSEEMRRLRKEHPDDPRLA